MKDRFNLLPVFSSSLPGTCLVVADDDLIDKVVKGFDTFGDGILEVHVLLVLVLVGRLVNHLIQRFSSTLNCSWTHYGSR